MKNVKSTDPRKPVIMEKFKEAFPGATKVTNVRDLGDDRFRATLHRYVGDRKYELMGTFTIVANRGPFNLAVPEGESK